MRQLRGRIGFVLGDLPNWMDAQFLRGASGALVIAAVLLVIITMFVVKSIGTRVVVVLLLLASVAGLVRYRQTLDHCDKAGCACRLFGQVVPGDNCSNR